MMANLDVTSSDYGKVRLDANQLGKLHHKELDAAEKFLRIEKDQRYRKGNISDEARKEVDIELGNATLPHSYEEIKRLLEIERQPVYAKALEEWSRKESLFTSRVEGRKKKVSGFSTGIDQLIVFYYLFQGVLFTALLQNNLLHCNDCWIPTSLSVGVSIVTILGVILKLKEIAKLRKTILSEELSLKEVKRSLQTLRNTGVKGFESAQFEYTDHWVQNTRWLRFFSLTLIGTLVLFAAICPYAFFVIMCHRQS